LLQAFVEEVTMTTSTLPAPGDRIAEYTVERRVGEGGMGVVYLARSPGGRPMALKVLRPEKLDDPGIVAAFHREGDATASVDHEAVVQVLGAGSVSGRHYILMEYVDGPPLDRLLEARGRLPWKFAVKVAIQIAEALAAAHERGLLHRDVKPGNVLLYRDGRARLTDFGIVKDIRSLKGFLVTGRAVGTAAYASPEQCLGKRLGPATDIYSLGATLYEMVCGRPPFRGSSRSDVMKKHVKAPARPPHEVVDGLPRALSNAIVKMLEKSPLSRPETAAGVAADLTTILEGRVPMGARGPAVSRKALRGLRSTKSSWRERRGA
jgi:serine/threonine-protein kinase